MKRALLLSFTCAVLAACGGSVSENATDGGGTDGGTDTATSIEGGIDTAEPPPRFDSGFTRDSAPPPPIDGGPVACNDLANIGDVIDEVRIAAPLPTLVGAASIPTGTYVLVKNEIYSGTGGAAGKTGKTLKETLLVTSGEVQSVLSQNGAADKDSTLGYTISGGRKLHAVGTCGDSSTTAVDFDFEVVGTQLRIGLAAAGGSYLVTFEKK
jgi:hypothetical protein